MIVKPIQSGSRSARIMVVAESPGKNEVERGAPLVGASGHEFDHWLGKAQWARSALFLTNICHERPADDKIEHFFAGPQTAKRLGAVLINHRWALPPIVEGLKQLQSDIDEIQPTLILALGGTALWALTALHEVDKKGKWQPPSILKRRGSILRASGGPVDGHGIKLVAALHPAYILRERVYRIVSIYDIVRAKRESEFPEIREPQRDCTVPRTPAEAEDWFNDCARGDTALASDVENNIATGDLTCLGFASSPTRAICIPFTHRIVEPDADPSYWSLEDEMRLTTLCRARLRAHPLIFHNGLHDIQILARHWGIMPNMTDDTMVGQHVWFPGMLGGKIDPVTGEVSKKGSSLSLSFCASIYCDFYAYWKDSGRGWSAEVNTEEEYWQYNCLDTTYDFEIWHKIIAGLTRHRLIDQYRERMRLFEPVFEMMFDGLAFDDEQRNRDRTMVRAQIKEIQDWINRAVGFPLNVASAPQMKALFYNDMQCKPVLDRKTHKPTLNGNALDVILSRMPVLRPLIEHIQAIRTLKNFDSNCLAVKLGPNGRLMAALNVGYVETMRFSSNENAFGEGLNLQNWPRYIED